MVLSRVAVAKELVIVDGLPLIRRGFIIIVVVFLLDFRRLGSERLIFSPSRRLLGPSICDCASQVDQASWKARANSAIKSIKTRTYTWVTGEFGFNSGTTLIIYTNLC